MTTARWGFPGIFKKLSGAVLAAGVVLSAHAPDVQAGPSNREAGRTNSYCDGKGDTIQVYLERVSREMGSLHRVADPDGSLPLSVSRCTLQVAALREALASLYSLSWLRSEQEFLLTRTETDLRTRKRAAAKALQEGRRRLRLRWNEVGRMLQMSPAQLEALARQGDDKARVFLKPTGRYLAEMAFSLPDGIVNQILDGTSVRVPFSSLPRTAQMAALRMAETLPVSRLFPPPTELVPREGVLEVGLRGPVYRPTVQVMLRFGHSGEAKNLLYMGGSQREEPSQRRRLMVRSLRRIEEGSPLLRRVSLTDPSLRASRLRGTRPPDAKPLAILLAELADQVHLPILAQCEYMPKDNAWVDRQWWLGGDIQRKPLHECLDLLCADFKFEWRFEKGVLLLRPLLWFEDKPKEQSQ